MGPPPLVGARVLKRERIQPRVNPKTPTLDDQGLSTPRITARHTDGLARFSDLVAQLNKDHWTLR
jgi:hypothetical protein